MTTTKSIRFDSEELEDIQRVLKFIPAASEAALLKDSVRRGLAELKKDLTVRLFAREGYTSGEIAEALNMSRLAVIETLRSSGLKLLDIDEQDFAEDLERDLP